MSSGIVIYSDKCLVFGAQCSGFMSVKCLVFSVWCLFVCLFVCLLNRD